MFSFSKVRSRLGDDGRQSIDGRPARRTSSMWAAGMAMVALLGAIGVGAGPRHTAVAAPPQVSVAKNAFGYPLWYEDNVGTRLEPCLDTQDTLHCVILPNPGVFDSQQPMVLPTNFPDEFFYHVVDSDKIATPGCAAVLDPLNPASQPGFAFVRLALEGAFANGLPALGDQMVFGRIRIVVKGGLCPGQSYTFTHPYGSTTLTANASGGIRPVEGTVDIGCKPVAPAQCNFAQALGSPMLASFLRWDPAVLPLADPGYLGGDAAVLHPIVGSPTGTNFFAVTDNVAAAEIARTTQFTVSGKVAGPLSPSSTRVDLGGQIVDGGHGDSTVTLTNVGAAPLLMNGLAAFGVAGANAAEFSVVSTTCAANNNQPALARDESCTVTVRFSPVTPAQGSPTGPRDAALTVAHDGIRSPLSIALHGTSINPGQEPDIAISVPNGSNPPELQFGSVRIGTEGVAQAVTITNTGVAPLQVTGLQFVNVTGPTAATSSFDSNDHAAFRIAFDACSGTFVPALASNTCNIYVAFAPIHTHDYLAALKVTANTSGGPREVTLKATGIGGVAAVSTGPDGAGPDGIDATNGFPTWYQDEAGVRVGQCLDPNDPLCIVLPDDFYRGGALVGLPTFANFPSEFFYFVSDSDQIATPGCGSSPPGKAFIRMADEGAFTNTVTDGEQMAFGRIRIVVTSGLCPNTPYVFTHPYGQITLTTDAAGGIRRNAATQDIGCFPIPGDVCNFAQALASPVLGGFLSQVGAPAGYLGDPKVFAPVTGAPFLDPETAQPANLFRIRQVSAVPNAVGPLVGETSAFTAMGKLVGPVMANPSSLDFGSVEVGTTSAEQTVTYTNDGITDVTVGTVSTGGPSAAEYAIVNNGCNGHLLRPVAVSNDSCQVRVRFTPAGNGTRVAKLVMTHTGRNNPMLVPMTGVGGAAVGQAAISVQPLAATFADLHIATALDTPSDNHISAPESIKVSNQGGTAPLKIGTADLGAGRPDPSITGPGAANFGLVNHCTAAVAPNQECVIDVVFNPQVAGDLAAFLDIPNNVSAVGNLVQVPLSGRGFNGAPAQSAGLNSSGFPSWFQDDNGVRVEPCLYQGDPNCVLLPDATYNAANPLVFPTNFPAEFFYSLVDSNIMTIPADPTCGGGGGTSQLRIALEGSFATGTPLAGQQITFARIRFNATGLCANTTYSFVHPYGTTALTSDGNGVVKNTLDVPNVLPSNLLAKGLLRWDPNSSPAAPAGYLGDGRSFHPITGSRYRPAPGADPVNFYRVRGGGINETTKDFLVSGRIAGPVVADVTSRTFAPQVVGTQSAAQTVTLTNIGPVAVSAITPSLGGTDAAEFQIVPTGTCQSPAPATLTLDQSCAVAVRFAPGLTSTPGPKTAVLTIGHDGLRSPITVTLTGTATPGGAPEIHVTPASLAFGNQNVGVASAPLAVTIQNTGTAALDITGITLTGTGAGSFTHNNACVSVPAGQFCTFQVRMNPTSAGNKTATLSIASNDLVRGTVNVALTGTGVAPIMSLTPTSLSFQTKGTATKTVNVTNTGTAVLNLVGAPAIAVIGQVPASNPVKFTATHNCNNVAPGGKCTITVTFNPGAGPNNETITATLRITSNAANSPQTVALSGQRK